MKRYNVTAIAPNRTLDAAISDSDTTLALDAAPAGAPDTPFQIAVWEELDGAFSRSEMEVMEVTAISGATLTIGERGMESTSARSFSTGALVTIGLWTPSQLDHAIGFEEDAGQQSGTYEWDVDASPHLRIELTGDLTINATGVRNGRRVVLLLIQDSTGGHSLTLGNGFATANGEQLDISTDADAISALGGFTSGGAVIIDVGKSEAPSGDLQVQTDAATGLDTGTATLNGELIALPDGETAQAAFEYRKTSGGVWVVTPEQTLNNPSTFNEALTGLDEEEHEFRARAESAGLIEVGNVVTFTPEGGLSQEVQDYVDAVNATRSSNLASGDVDTIEEMWARLGNSESELTRNYQIDVQDIFLLRSVYNTDDSSTSFSFRTHNLTLSGGASLGPDGVIFSGQGNSEKVTLAGPVVIGLPQASFYFLARVEGQDPLNRYLSSQASAGLGNGSFTGMQASSSEDNALIFYVSDADGLEFTGSNSYWQPLNTWRGAVGVHDPQAGEARVYSENGDLIGDNTQVIYDTDFANADYVIGGRETDNNRQFSGTIAVHVVIEDLDPSDISALHTIISSTVGAGL